MSPSLFFMALLAAIVVLVLCSGWWYRRQFDARLEEARVAQQWASPAQMATLEERLKAKGAELDQVRAQLRVSEEGRERLREELTQAREALVRSQTELDRERVLGAEKLAFLESAKSNLVAQFKTLADEILEEKSQRFSSQHKSELDLLLKPLGEKLQSFEQKVTDTYVNEAKERFSLAEEVRKLQAANLQISQEAVNLTRALKGDSKTRGNWGEVILERVLERSGLVKGREYATQLNLEGEAGRQRPDIVVQLPENKHIVIDSKVSLVAYDRYHSADGEIERELALKDHVAAVRRHIDQLSAKNYQGQGALNTPDFVAMFVPIEPAFFLAAERDESLYLDAFDKKVVIVTPATLLAMLSTVSTLWRRERQTQNALEIARRSGDLYDKFVGFVAALQDIGSKLAAAQNAYDQAYGRLTDGRGNLVKRVEDLKSLGARADKALPVDLLKRAGVLDSDGLYEDGEPVSPDAPGASEYSLRPPSPTGPLL